MSKLPTWILLILSTTIFSLTTSCSALERNKEVERVERIVISYDQSRPLPQNSGIKVSLDQMSQGVLYQPGQEPAFVLVSPGTYAFLGVEVYRRMYALVSAIKAVESQLTPEQRAVFREAQQKALLELDEEPSQ